MRENYRDFKVGLSSGLVNAMLNRRRLLQTSRQFYAMKCNYEVDTTYCRGCQAKQWREWWRVEVVGERKQQQMGMLTAISDWRVHMYWDWKRTFTVALWDHSLWTQRHLRMLYGLYFWQASVWRRRNMKVSSDAGPCFILTVIMGGRRNARPCRRERCGS